MAQKRINTRSNTKEKPYIINSHNFCKMGKQKGQQGEQNMCMYVSEICAEVIFVSFPWY